MRRGRRRSAPILPAVARAAFLASACLLEPATTWAQDVPPVVARTVAARCGSARPRADRAVLAGTVADSVSGKPMAGARVVGVWWKGGQPSATSRATTTDRQGVFVFCDLPGDMQASLTVIFGGRASRILTGLELPAGRIHVERVRLAPPRRPTSSRAAGGSGAGPAGPAPSPISPIPRVSRGSPAQVVTGAV